MSEQIFFFSLRRYFPDPLGIQESFREIAARQKRIKFPLLKRYVFYPIQMEVQENAQEQSIMVGRIKQTWSSFDDYLKTAYWYPRIPPDPLTILLWYPRIPQGLRG